MTEVGCVSSLFLLFEGRRRSECFFETFPPPLRCINTKDGRSGGGNVLKKYKEVPHVSFHFECSTNVKYLATDYSNNNIRKIPNKNDIISTLSQ